LYGWTLNFDSYLILFTT